MQEGDIVTFAFTYEECRDMRMGYKGPNDSWKWTITGEMKEFAQEKLLNYPVPKLEVRKVNLYPDGRLSSVMLRGSSNYALWPPESLRLISTLHKKKRVKLSF